MPKFKLVGPDTPKETEVTVTLDDDGNVDLKVEGELVLSILSSGKLMLFGVSPGKTGLRVDDRGMIELVSGH